MYFDPVIVIAISLVANVGLALGWFLSNRRLRQREARNLGLGPTDDQRTVELAHSIQALAAQVDELAAGQDFLNRVITDKVEKLVRALPGSAATRGPA
jgi:hypothetical protein